LKHRDAPVGHVLTTDIHPDTRELLLRSVERQGIAELLRPTPEDPSPQKLDLLEVLQGSVLVLDLLGAFRSRRS
jgi:hypothetical protein